MNILVTGGAGFIGSNLTDKLVELGHNVIIVDNLSTGKRENINPDALFYEMDLNDDKLSTIFIKHEPECVFHLAAQVDVRKSVADPLHDASTNIMGTLNLLKESTNNNIKKFIFSSSGGVIYGETPEPATEDNPSSPVSPYGVAKLAGEGYIKCFAQWQGLNYTILRYANVYGPRQDLKGEAGVVSIFIGQIGQGIKSYLYGVGKLERDYVFVEDVVRANMLCIENGVNSTFNIGTGIATTVEKLHTMIEQIAARHNKKEFAPKRAGELERNVLNIERARKQLGWKPHIALKDGLKKTYEWFITEAKHENGN